MSLELGAQGTSPVANAGGLSPQLGIIDHFFDVAEPIGPVKKIAAGQRCELFRIDFVEWRNAPPPGGIVQTLSSLTPAALRLPALTRTALTVGLPGLIRLLILRIAGLFALLTRLPAPAGLAIASLAATALLVSRLTGTLAGPFTAARTLAWLLAVRRISLGRLLLVLFVARLAPAGLSGSLGALAGLPFTGLALAGLLRRAPFTALTFATLSLSLPLLLIPTRLPLTSLSLAGLIFRRLPVSGLLSFAALAGSLPLASLLLPASLLFSGLLAFGAGLAAVTGIAGDFSIDLVGQLPQLVASPAQGFGFVTQNRFGGPLDSFAKLADAAAGDFLLLPRVVRQSTAHRPLGGLQGPVEVLVLRVAGGVVEAFGEERLGLLGILKRLPHPLGEIDQPLSLLGQILLDPLAAAVVAE